MGCDSSKSIDVKEFKKRRLQEKNLESENVYQHNDYFILNNENSEQDDNNMKKNINKISLNINNETKIEKNEIINKDKKEDEIDKKSVYIKDVNLEQKDNNNLINENILSENMNKNKIISNSREKNKETKIEDDGKNIELKLKNNMNEQFIQNNKEIDINIKNEENSFINKEINMQNTDIANINKKDNDQEKSLKVQNKNKNNEINNIIIDDKNKINLNENFKLENKIEKSEDNIEKKIQEIQEEKEEKSKNEKIMLKYSFENRIPIKSKFIIKKIFSHLEYITKLKMVNFNKHLQNVLNIGINDYKFSSKKYKVTKDGMSSLFLFERNILVYQGQFLNGKRNGPGKEYYNNGKIIKFEGEYLNDKEWNGKGYNNKGETEYEIKNGIKIFWKKKKKWNN